MPFDKEANGPPCKAGTSLLPSIRENGVRIIHSPSNCLDHYNTDPQSLDYIRRDAFYHGPVDPSKPQSLKINELNRDPCDPESKWDLVWPPELAGEKYKTLNPDPNREDKNILCEEPNDRNKLKSIWQWTREHWDIEIKVPDVVAFENESFRILKFLEARNIKHLVYAGTATNYCVLWSRYTSMYYLNKLARNKKVPLQLYLARDLTDSAYMPAAASIETHDVGTVETVGVIEMLGFPSILSSRLGGGHPSGRNADNSRPAGLDRSSLPVRRFTGTSKNWEPLTPC